MNTIYTVKPSIRIFQAVGIAPITIDRSLKVVTSSSFQVYSSVLLVIFSIAFIFGLFNSELHLNAENNGIGNTVDYIQLVGIRICHILILLESLLQHKNVTIFFEKLCEFDFLVQRKLNMLKDHRQERRRISLQLATLLCFYILCEIIFVVIVILRKDYEFFEYWAIYLLPFVVCCLKYTQAVGFVQLIKTRYQFLNDKLATLKWPNTNAHQESLIIRKEKLVTPIEYMERHLQQLNVNKLTVNQKKKQTITSIDDMIVIRSLFDKVCDLAGLINQIFGLSMLINIGNDFVAITSNSYFIFVYFQDTSIQNKDSWKILGSIIWSAPHLFNIILLTAICHSTVQTANQTALTVHKIEYDHLNEKQNLFMEQFSLQLLHQKIIFTACGFFNVDFTLIFTMIGATTTYLIILIQFHMSEVAQQHHQAET